MELGTGHRAQQLSLVISTFSPKLNETDEVSFSVETAFKLCWPLIFGLPPKSRWSAFSIRGKEKNCVKLRTGFRHLSRRWHLICVIVGLVGPKCGRFSSEGELISTKLTELSSSGYWAPRFPKLAKIERFVRVRRWTIRRHLRLGPAPRSVGGPTGSC